MRIAVAGFHIESSTYNPNLSVEDDFDISRGAELLDAPVFAFLNGVEAEIVPIFFARALPGPPISPATYEAFQNEILDGLAAAGPLDGIYLALHGAANVAGMDDAEGHFAQAIRAAAGPDVPIAVSLDLHGNVSQQLVDAIDIVSAYRTAPHIDVERTMRKAVEMLTRAIATGERPSVCWCPIPVVLPGERTVTTAEPAKSLYASLDEVESLRGIWDASLMVGFVWADEPRVSAAALVTGTDAAAMRQSAGRLATDYWAARDAFVFGTYTGSIDDCVARALASPTGPVFLSDSGDNVTAGGAGDRTDLLRALLATDATGTLVAGLADARAVAAAYRATLGDVLPLELGGSLDPAGGGPLAVSARLVSRRDDVDATSGEAVFDIAGITVIVTSRRKAFTLLADFAAHGIDPLNFRVVVVKLGYLFPELAPLAHPALMALSEGIVDQSVERLPRHRTPRPTYPFDRDFDYVPAPRFSKRFVL